MQDQRAIWEARYAAGRSGNGTAQPTDFCARLAELLTQPSRVLEIGAGPGDDAAFLAIQGHEVIATDVSAAAVEAARSRYSDIRGLSLEQHDASDHFDLPDASLDAVYARLSLHYFPDAASRGIFAELARLLRPGGLIAFMCKSTSDPLYGKGTLLEPDVFESSHLRHFFSEPYARELLAPSFEVVSIEAKSGLLYESQSAWIEVIGRIR